MKHLFHSVLIILFSFGLGHAVFAMQHTIIDDVKREVVFIAPLILHSQRSCYSNNINVQKYGL